MTNGLRIAATAMRYGLKLLTMDSHSRKVPQIIVG
jgi:predicted nucleic acid-binding protein